MTKERLGKIKENVASSKGQAEDIMEGGENYDGADGAREVLQLCGQAEELIAAIEAGKSE